MAKSDQLDLWGVPEPEQAAEPDAPDDRVERLRRNTEEQNRRIRQLLDEGRRMTRAEAERIQRRYGL
jgi:hypothetical protein